MWMVVLYVFVFFCAVVQQILCWKLLTKIAIWKTQNLVGNSILNDFIFNNKTGYSWQNTNTKSSIENVVNIVLN